MTEEKAKPPRVTINGVEYAIFDVALDGFTDNPEQYRNGRKVRRRRFIYVNADDRGQRKHLEGVVHEVIHNMTPGSPENWVMATAHSIARVGWIFGYRVCTCGECKCLTGARRAYR